MERGGAEPGPGDGQRLSRRRRSSGLVRQHNDDVRGWRVSTTSDEMSASISVCGAGTCMPRLDALPRDAPVRGDREFWRGVLIAGGFTSIPRWTQQPSTGVGECEERVSILVAAGLRRLADAWSIPLSAFFLAAHAKVVAALCGEPAVVTGYVPAAGDEALPCRMSTEAASWRELIHDVWRSETELLAHRDFPVATTSRAPVPPKRRRSSCAPPDWRRRPDPTERIEMTTSSPSSPSWWSPGRASRPHRGPIPAGSRPPGLPDTVTRFMPRWPNTAPYCSAASDCVIPTGLGRCLPNWPARG